MHHRHRPRRPPRRPRLRPAREIQTETASGGRITGAQQRASRPTPTATRQPASHHRDVRHLRDLAAAAPHPRRNRPAWAVGRAGPAGPAGLDRGSGTPPGHQLRPPPLQRPPRPQPPPPPPGGNTRRGVRLSALPPRRGPLRLRAHYRVRKWRRRPARAMRGPAAVITTTRNSTRAGEWSSTSPATAPGPPPRAAPTPPDPPPTRSDPRRRWSGRARGRRTCGPRPGPGPRPGQEEDKAAAGMARLGTAPAAPHGQLPGVTSAGGRFDPHPG